MNLETQMASLIIHSQPKSIVNRLLHNYDLFSVVGLVDCSYEGVGTFDHNEIIAALEKAHNKQASVSLRTKDGKEFRIERLPEGIKASELGGEKHSRFVPEFEFLDPLPNVRLSALTNVIVSAVTWFPSATFWQAILETRPLTEFELTRLVSEIQMSPIYFFSSLRKKWQYGNISAKDLVPTSAFYYQSLLGPMPEGGSVDDYIRDILNPHQKRIVEHNLTAAVAFCFPSFLRDDISPSSILEGIPDDSVFDALANINLQDNPFVLLAAVDVAVNRQSRDSRFERIASGSIQRLTQQKLVGKDGLNTYELMAPLVRLCYRLISIEAIFINLPQYWRWLAAFLHSHFLLDILRAKPIDVESFTSWCDNHMDSRILAKELIDFQQGPAWTTNRLTPESLRSQCFGRLLALADRVRKQGLPGTFWEKIQVEVEPMGQNGALIFAMYPGPLEGHLRPKNKKGLPTTDAQNMADLFSGILTELETEPFGEAWNKLAASTSIVIYEDSLIKRIENAVSNIKCREEDRLLFFNALQVAAFIAATQSDEVLSNAVAAAIYREAVKFTTDVETETGYRIILIASAAIIERTKWLEWLENKMAEFASSLPRGTPCVQLFNSLQTLKTLFPLKEWCFGRAIKLTCGAIR